MYFWYSRALQDHLAKFRRKSACPKFDYCLIGTNLVKYNKAEKEEKKLTEPGDIKFLGKGVHFDRLTEAGAKRKQKEIDEN